MRTCAPVCPCHQSRHGTHPASRNAPTSDPGPLELVSPARDLAISGISQNHVWISGSGIHSRVAGGRSPSRAASPVPPSPALLISPTVSLALAWHGHHVPAVSNTHKSLLSCTDCPFRFIALSGGGQLPCFLRSDQSVLETG